MLNTSALKCIKANIDINEGEIHDNNKIIQLSTLKIEQTKRRYLMKQKLVTYNKWKTPICEIKPYTQTTTGAKMISK